MSETTVLDPPTETVETVETPEITETPDGIETVEAPEAAETPAETPVEEGAAEVAEPVAEVDAPVEEAPKPKPAKPAKDARYQATGKRKTAVARVILTPGDGFWINGRTLEEYFPRHALRAEVLKPFLASGTSGLYQVRARIHGGGVSAQAGALRHGVSRALSEIGPDVRASIKSVGLLQFDARQVERKKAGLKKARKRPQFSKR